ncbi:acyl-CoA N-acyltransferase [Myriangium duriaei CBS 260.36]|uniref:Acyl-CoA N-acyltransferase n=1 Tax=Myriangium duriaei CBS 260.36 TaxID=1168546 RepID=A0A9P4J445_9PEZI|nr:acyl-CoA N-acyltransferase [Myriangium duriaei CBS 260.36]
MPNTVWASDRLIYRAVEKDDEAFLTDLYADEATFTQAANFIPVPLGKQAMTGLMGFVEKSLLGVIICLPTADSDAQITPSNEPSEGKTPAGKSKPTPLGLLTLAASDSNTVHHRNTSIGITVSSAFRDKGYGSEAILWGLNWAFMHANMHKVELLAYGWNPRAIQLYERLGFVQEGRRREQLWYQGKYLDAFEFGILQREWMTRYGSQQG